MIIDRSESCAAQSETRHEMAGAQCERAILKRTLFMISRGLAAFWHFAFSHDPPSVDLALIFGGPNDQTNQANPI